LPEGYGFLLPGRDHRLRNSSFSPRFGPIRIDSHVGARLVEEERLMEEEVYFAFIRRYSSLLIS
jgi:hypothetical protein